MTQKFKSDARPSDTKSVVLHKENDKRLLDHLQTIKRESAFWRTAGNFYLDFTEWLATQPDAPAPGQPFAVYRAWLESRQPSNLPTFQPSDLAAAILPGVRDIIEAALAGMSLSPSLLMGEGRGEGLELAELFSSELVLE